MARTGRSLEYRLYCMAFCPWQASCRCGIPAHTRGPLRSTEYPMLYPPPAKNTKHHHASPHTRAPPRTTTPTHYTPLHTTAHHCTPLHTTARTPPSPAGVAHVLACACRNKRRMAGTTFHRDPVQKRPRPRASSQRGQRQGPAGTLDSGLSLIISHTLFSSMATPPRVVGAVKLLTSFRRFIINLPIFWGVFCGFVVHRITDRRLQSDALPEFTASGTSAISWRQTRRASSCPTCSIRCRGFCSPRTGISSGWSHRTSSQCRPGTGPLQCGQWQSWAG